MELAGVAGWVRAYLPADAVLLIQDAGYIAWGTTARLVDFVGLKAPASVRPNQLTGHRGPSSEGWTLEP